MLYHSHLKNVSTLTGLGAHVVFIFLSRFGLSVGKSVTKKSITTFSF